MNREKLQHILHKRGIHNKDIEDEILDLHLASKPFGTATETTDNIVKGRKYEIVDEEQMGYYIIDETGEEVYYHHAALNVC